MTLRASSRRAIRESLAGGVALEPRADRFPVRRRCAPGPIAAVTSASETKARSRKRISTKRRS